MISFFQRNDGRASGDETRLNRGARYSIGPLCVVLALAFTFAAIGCFVLAVGPIIDTGGEWWFAVAVVILVVGLRFSRQ